MEIRAGIIVIVMIIYDKKWFKCVYDVILVDEHGGAAR